MQDLKHWPCLDQNRSKPVQTGPNRSNKLLFCVGAMAMAFARGGRHNVARRERGLYPSQRTLAAEPLLLPRRDLIGSYVRLEDGSRLYRTEIREYEARKDGTSGFPALRFDGLAFPLKVGVACLRIYNRTGPLGSCPFRPLVTRDDSDDSDDAGREAGKRPRPLLHAVDKLDGYCECCNVKYVLLYIVGVCDSLIAKSFAAKLLQCADALTPCVAQI